MCNIVDRPEGVNKRRQNWVCHRQVLQHPNLSPHGTQWGTCTQQGQCQYGTKNKGTHTWVCLGPHKRLLLADCE